MVISSSPTDVVLSKVSAVRSTSAMVMSVSVTVSVTVYEPVTVPLDRVTTRNSWPCMVQVSSETRSRYSVVRIPSAKVVTGSPVTTACASSSASPGAFAVVVATASASASHRPSTQPAPSDAVVLAGSSASPAGSSAAGDSSAAGVVGPLARVPSGVPPEDAPRRSATAVGGVSEGSSIVDRSPAGRAQWPA